MIHARAEWVLRSNHPNHHKTQYRYSLSNLVLTLVKYNLKDLKFKTSTFLSLKYLNNQTSISICHSRKCLKISILHSFHFHKYQTSISICHSRKCLKLKASMLLSHNFHNNQTLIWITHNNKFYFLKLLHLMLLFNPSRTPAQEPTTIEVNAYVYRKNYKI